MAFSSSELQELQDSYMRANGIAQVLQGLHSGARKLYTRVTTRSLGELVRHSCSESRTS